MSSVNSTTNIPVSTAIKVGLHRGFPIVLGYVPVAFAFGVLAVKNGFSPGFAILMSLMVFAGSGQFVAVSLWGSGVGAASVILTVFVVNLRHLLMSASLSTYMKGTKRWQRFLLGCQLTDETFGVHASAFQQGWQRSLVTMYTCNTLTQMSWVFGTVLGVFFGTLITDVRPMGLDYALTAMFLALLIPQCRNNLHVFIAIFAGSTSVVLKSMGLGQWNVIVATIVAATLGLFISKLRFIRQRKKPENILAKTPKNHKE